MYPTELIEYVTKRTQYKARQIVRRVPSLGDVEDVQHDLLEDVFRRLPRFNGDRAGVKTFICRIIDNKIADLLRTLDRTLRGRNARGPSVDDWVLDEDGAWARRDAVIDEARSRAHLGVFGRSAEEQQNLAMDTAAVVAKLTPEQQKLCVRLQSQTPTEISRETGMSRSILYQRIAALRDIFLGARLHLHI